MEFVRANPTNLPKLDTIMIMEFMKSSVKHNIAEIRGAKALMSSRDSYVDTAVGYVEVSRGQDMCIVRAKVVPEHKVSKKLYVVTADINEKEDTIHDTSCDGCAAQAGGCKHSLVLLYWLQKQSMTPSSTSLQCYWKKPRLSAANSIKLKAKDFKGYLMPAPKDPNVLAKFLEEAKKHNCQESLLLKYKSSNNSDDLWRYCVFDLALQYLETDTEKDKDKFIKFCTDATVKVKDSIAQATLEQSKSKLWAAMRQARITGSTISKMAHCKTVDGALTQQILGGYKVPETKAILRGKRLESQVINEITKIKQEIKPAGFYITGGIFGASPDGLGKDFVVEVKCPMSEKTQTKYTLQNDDIKAQIHLQMLATGLKRGLLCVADPSFEETKKINMTWVNYDETYIMGIMKDAQSFWEKSIFPKIILKCRDINKNNNTFNTNCVLLKA